MAMPAVACEPIPRKGSGDADRVTDRRKSELRTLKNRFSGVFRVSRPRIAGPFSVPRTRVVGCVECRRFAPAQMATVSRRDATVLRHDATLSRHDGTLSRAFAHVAKVDLRRIACDFLTAGFREGVPETFATGDHFATRSLGATSGHFARSARHFLAASGSLVRYSFFEGCVGSVFFGGSNFFSNSATSFLKSSRSRSGSRSVSFFMCAASL